nr:hypothetical protein [Hankyongella ginsenosidimutans]
MLRQSALKADDTLDEAGRNKHAHRLAELAHWAEPLDLPPERITFHVLEAMNPAEALLDYARMNHVDHIVMGPAPSRWDVGFSAASPQKSQRMHPAR